MGPDSNRAFGAFNVLPNCYSVRAIEAASSVRNSFILKWSRLSTRTDDLLITNQLLYQLS